MVQWVSLLVGWLVGCLVGGWVNEQVGGVIIWLVGGCQESSLVGGLAG